VFQLHGISASVVTTLPLEAATLPSVERYSRLRSDCRTTLKQFAGGSIRYRFSSDDRWLSIWSDDTIEILDLTGNEIALRLRPGHVEEVGFEASSRILSVQLDDGAMLVPLDRSLTEQFVKWLAPRSLTASERCMYGLGDKTCPGEVAAR